MILTAKGRYAIMAIVDIAENDGCNKPSCLSDISKRQQISLSYLEQIFLKLKKAEIVNSIKGPGGGYVLAKPSDQVTIEDVVNAIGEKIKMTRCGNGNKGCRDDHTKCRTHDLWKGLELTIQSYLKSIKINDIGNIDDLDKAFAIKLEAQT